MHDRAWHKVRECSDEEIDKLDDDMVKENPRIMKTTEVGCLWNHVWALMDNNPALEIMEESQQRAYENGVLKLERQVFCRPTRLLYYLNKVLNNYNLFGSDLIPFLEFKFLQQYLHFGWYWFFLSNLPSHYFWEEKAHNYNIIIISWIHSHLISVEQHSHLPSGGAAVIPRRGGVGGPDVLSVAEPQTHKLIDLEGL